MIECRWPATSSLSPPRTLPAGSPLHNPSTVSLLLAGPPHTLTMNPSGPLDLPHRALLAHHSPPHPIVLWVLAPLNPHLHPSCHKRRPRDIPDLVGCRAEKSLSWCRVGCALCGRQPRTEGCRAWHQLSSAVGVAAGCHPIHTLFLSSTPFYRVFPIFPLVFPVTFFKCGLPYFFSIIGSSPLPGQSLAFPLLIS